MYKPRLAGMHYDMGHKYGALLYKNNVRLDELLVLMRSDWHLVLKVLKYVRRYTQRLLMKLRD